MFLQRTAEGVLNGQSLLHVHHKCAIAIHRTVVAGHPRKGFLEKGLRQKKRVAITIFCDHPAPEFFFCQFLQKPWPSTEEKTRSSENR